MGKVEVNTTPRSTNSAPTPHQLRSTNSPQHQVLLLACDCLCDDAAGVAASEIETLLLESIAAPEEARRLAAVQWVKKLYPFHNVAARYVCCLAAGDRRMEVRDAGLSGLKAPVAKKAEGKRPPKAAGSRLHCPYVRS